jgi:integrase
MLRLGYEHRKLAQLPRFPTIRAENARQVYFTKGELDGLVKALPEEIAEGGRGDVGNEWLVPFVITAFWTGARLRELLHLERRRLDLDAGKITLPPGSTKNRKGRTFYLPLPALSALREWDGKTRALERERGIIVRTVFHRYGKPLSDEFPYGVFHAACTRAGIAGRRKIHDFRRSAARNYRASGVSEGVVMAICGWRTRAMFDRYDIKNEDDLRKAAAQVTNSDEVVARSGGAAEITPISKK